MFTLGKKLGLAALLVLSTTSANALVLDSFDYDITLAVDGTGDTASGTATSVTNTVPAGDVTYTLTNLEDNSGSNITAMASIERGQLEYSEGTLTDGSLMLSYFDADGTAPIDITDAGGSVGFYFDVLSADLGFEVFLTISDGFATSTATYTLNYAIESLERVFLSFNDFVGSADFTNVTTISALINSPSASDLVLTEVGTVPEPSTIAIFGLALLGFGFSARRKAK